MSLYGIEAVILYFVAVVGLEVVKLVEDWDVVDLGEGGGVCFGDVDFDGAPPAPLLAGLPLHWLLS